jgi:hypothetical protein
MSQTYIPVERYRSSTVTNGGTTIQNISSVRSESRNVVDTKALTDVASRALTDQMQADIGGSVSFVLKIPNKLPVPIPIPPPPHNPHTS